MGADLAGSGSRTGVLAGKVAIVTGAASGIGWATAELFASEGAAIYAVDIDEAREAVDALGTEAMFVRADVSQAADCEAIVAAVHDRFRRIDVLFNNAAIIIRATVLETAESEWDRLMAVNVRSVYLLSRRVIPLMAAAGSGAIVNTASAWGLAAGPRAAAYCASKGAVVQLTKAMAIDHGPQGIRVNCICPGDTDTPMLRQEAIALGEPVDRFLGEAADRPLRRVAAPGEIARAALYLASDDASFVTGTALVVDGGGLAGR